MPDTLADIIVPSNDWISVEDVTGISAGTALVIQNKGFEGVLLAIGTVKPDADSEDGPTIYGAPNNYSIITVDSGENAVWLKSTSNLNSRVNIQIGTGSGGGGGGTPVTVQSNWAETDTASDAFIQNKPTSLSQFTDDLDYVEGVTAGTGPVTVDNTDPQNPVINSTAIEGIRVEDEGTTDVASATALNFVGDLVSVADTGSNEATVTINSSSLTGTFSEPVTVQNSGTDVTTSAEQINFVGGGITATASGNDVTVTVPPIPTNLSQLANDVTLVEGVTVGVGNLTVDNSDPKNPVLNTSAIEGIRVEDEGTSTIATATAINFTGDGVTVTDAGAGEATVNVDTSLFINTFSAPITVQEEGVNVATAVDQINFVGAATASASGNDITVTIPPIPENVSDLTNDSVVASVVAVAPGISVDNTDPRNPRISTNAISGIATREEGVSVDTDATGLNFVGDLITATDAGNGITTVTVDSSSITFPQNAVAVSEEGTQLTADVSSINFVGGASATAAGDAVTVTLPDVPTDVSELTNTTLLEGVTGGYGISVDSVTDGINPEVSLDTSVGTASTMNLAEHRSFEISGNSFTFTNVPTGSATVKVVLNLTGTSATFPASTRWPGGTVPTLEAGRNIFVFTTNDGGTTWDAVHVGGGVFS